MKLSFFSRKVEKKCDVKRLRRDGKIPAVLYSNGKKGETITVMREEIDALLRKVKKNHLPTTILTFVGEDKKERKAIVKEIQYHVTTYQVIHIDFEELHDDVKVRLKVPIKNVGAADCVGVKQGGVIRTVMRHLKVECLPKDIPTSFDIPVKDLSIGASQRLKMIDLPKDVRPLMDLNEVAVVVAKR